MVKEEIHMEIKTVWAVYFSGTGTTEKVATHLARSLAGQLGAQYKSHDYTLSLIHI